MTQTIDETPKFVKLVQETFVIGFRYRATDPLFDLGDTISSGVITAIRLSDGTDVSTGGGAVLNTVVAVIDLAGLRTSADVVAGVVDEDYLITIVSTMTNGFVLVDCMIMKVRDCIIT